MSGTQYEQGDVVLVPFSDLSTAKQRPVLVLSKSSYNAAQDDIIICGITSNLDYIERGVMLEQLQQGSLPKLSVIRPDKLFSLHKKVVQKRLGKVHPSTVHLVKRRLNALI